MSIYGTPEFVRAEMDWRYAAAGVPAPTRPGLARRLRAQLAGRWESSQPMRSSTTSSRLVSLNSSWRAPG